MYAESFNQESKSKQSDKAFPDKNTKNPFDIGTTFSSSTKPSINDAARILNKEEDVAIPFEWSVPSSQKAKKDQNPFDIQQTSNPFSQQPTGPNPFDLAPQQKLPSLVDFIQQTQLNFSAVSQPSSVQQFQSTNPFIVTSSSGSSAPLNKAPLRPDSQVERIPRDPKQESQQKAKIIISPPATTTIRLEANPVGMPLLQAPQKVLQLHEVEEEVPDDDISKYFSRDRRPEPQEAAGASQQQYEDDDGDNLDDVEVIDHSNYMDELDFPRGEKISNDEENADDDDDEFSLENTEVIDYSEGSQAPYPGKCSMPLILFNDSMNIT